MTTAEYELDWRSLVSEKQLPQAAQIPSKRKDCITSALSQGVPLHAIEEYLDWLDAVRDNSVNRPSENK